MEVPEFFPLLLFLTCCKDTISSETLLSAKDMLHANFHLVAPNSVVDDAIIASRFWEMLKKLSGTADRIVTTLDKCLLETIHSDDTLRLDKLWMKQLI